MTPAEVVLGSHFHPTQALFFVTTSDVSQRVLGSCRRRPEHDCAGPFSTPALAVL